ncbi:MAG: phage fiber-tail adaptor protein [Planctomycetaceae bacterium]
MPASLSVSASRPKVKHPGESLLFGVDFTKLLTTDELLSAIASVVASPSGLTISGLTVNGAAFDNDEGGSVAAGRGAQFRVADGSAGADYTLTVSVTTTAANTRVVVCTLQVRDS